MKMAADLAREVIGHHLRLFGLDDSEVYGLNTEGARLSILIRPSAVEVKWTRSFMHTDGIIAAIMPEPDYCHAFGVKVNAATTSPPAVFTYQPDPKKAWARLRTLHSYHTFNYSKGSPVVVDRAGSAAWHWLQYSRGGILFVGTDISGDLVRYRQGDPAKDAKRPNGVLWGIPGERPNYLFSDQLEGESPYERHADWWAVALARFLSKKLGKPLLPLLPGGAPGAVIITGDDDQALLEKYNEQLSLLGRTPTTYFLHPLTRHSKKSIRKTLAKPWIDLGIHPDALEAPEQYGKLLTEQVAWYRSLVGKQPISLRNHGFLNDGYWGHLPAWLENGIYISSNLPGLDGTIMNGSLLPARLAYKDTLTPHWSMLTTVGDGMVTALNMSDTKSGDRILDLAYFIESNGVPGIIVLNLHPQNVAKTRAMHYATLEVIENGFHPWTLTECLKWFCKRDGFPFVETAKTIEQKPLKRLQALLMRRIIGQN